MTGAGNRAFFIAFVLCVVLGAFTQARASWTSGGPYVENITKLVMSRTDPDVMYAGTGDGVFKTLDGGETWATAGLSGRHIGALEVDPLDPDVVWAGASDRLYRSENAGIDWSSISVEGSYWLDSDVSVIAIDPHDPVVVYLGTVGNSGSGATFGVLYRSTDRGESWQMTVWAGDREEGVKDILVDVDDPSRIYAALQSGPDSGVNFAVTPDAGENWEFATMGTDDQRDVVALAMTPAGSQPAALYAIVEAEDVYKSTDGGDTWVPTSAPYTFASGPWALAVDPNDQDVVYAGTHRSGGEICWTNDGGDTWFPTAAGLPDGGPSGIVIDPRSSNVYVGLYEPGIYRSANAGAGGSWQRLGTPAAGILDLAVDPGVSERAFAVTRGRNGRLFSTSDAGESWSLVVGSPVNLGAVAIDPQNPSTIWVGDGFNSAPCPFDDICQLGFYMYRSIDAGLSWDPMRFYTAICYGPTSSCYSEVDDILIKEDDSQALLVSMSKWQGRLNRTTDGGQTWDGVSGSSITSLAADPNDPDLIYYGTRLIAQVFRYTDVWGSIGRAEITPAGGIGAVEDIEVGSDSTVYLGTSGGLWKWDGVGWTKFSSFPSNDATALAIDRSATPDTVYVGTGGDGVYASQDGGSSWTPFGGDLGALTIAKLSLSHSDPMVLYAGTEDGGVWSTVVAVADSDGDGIDDDGDGSGTAGDGPCTGGETSDCDDNCVTVGNAGQDDSDADGYGNVCDCDFNQDEACNVHDFNAFLPDFRSGEDSGVGTDMTCDGAVNVHDFNRFLKGFRAGSPGSGW